MKKTSLTTAAALMILASGLAACAAQPAAAPSADDTAGTVETVDQTEENAAESGAPAADTAGTPGKGFSPRLDPAVSGVVNVAGHYNNFEAIEEEFNRFNEFYPDVEMAYTYLDDYSGIIATAVGGSEAPDIFFTYPWMAQDEKFAALFDAAEDLSSEELGIDLSCIRDDLLIPDGEGRILEVPVYTTTYGMMVNEGIFEKEGIGIPKTYSELLTACEALRNAGYESPVMGYNSGDSLVFSLFYPHFIGTIHDDENAIRELNEMAPAAGEYMRSSLELAADFMGRGYVDIESCNALENDYDAVIMRFFEGDVPIMMATANTMSGTEKRESKSEAFSQNPFRYSFHLVPSTEEGGYFVNSISIGFGVNKNSENLDVTNEFMRFLITPDELGRMAKSKRMVSPCREILSDSVYVTLRDVDDAHFINRSVLGLAEEPDRQMHRAGWQVTNGQMTVDEAVQAFGTLE